MITSARESTKSSIKYCFNSTLFSLGTFDQCFNVLNRVRWGGPNNAITGANFGQIRDVNNSVMRFITFHGKFNF